jgi:hypothetical protein
MLKTAIVCMTSTCDHREKLWERCLLMNTTIAMHYRTTVRRAVWPPRSKRQLPSLWFPDCAPGETYGRETAYLPDVQQGVLNVQLPDCALAAHLADMRSLARMFFQVHSQGTGCCLLAPPAHLRPGHTKKRITTLVQTGVLK